MVPLSVLGRLRRESVEGRDAAVKTRLVQDCRRWLSESQRVHRLFRSTKGGRVTHSRTQDSVWHVLCRDMEAVEAVLTMGRRA